MQPHNPWLYLFFKGQQLANKFTSRQRRYVGDTSFPTNRHQTEDLRRVKPMQKHTSAFMPTFELLSIYFVHRTIESYIMRKEKKYQ